MMGTEWFPETLCFLSELTRLTAREDFIPNELTATAPVSEVYFVGLHCAEGSPQGIQKT
jgi:hypothetical protein